MRGGEVGLVGVDEGVVVRTDELFFGISFATFTPKYIVTMVIITTIVTSIGLMSLYSSPMFTIDPLPMTRIFDSGLDSSRATVTFAAAMAFPPKAEVSFSAAKA